MSAAKLLFGVAIFIGGTAYWLWILIRGEQEVGVRERWWPGE